MKNLISNIKTLLLLCFFAMSNVGNAQSPCSANFVYTINPNGNVTFSCTSLNTTTATAFNWAINNVYGAYTGPNPTMTFSVSGNYYITLQVTNYSPSCTAQSSQSVIVTNATCILNAGFLLGLGGGPGAMNFNNYSSGTVPGTTYLWDFGDNSGTSTVVSPVHTYSANGVYSATLIANNNFTSACTSTMVQSVSICNYGTPLNASYNYSINSGGNVTFTSTSTGVNAGTSYIWRTGIPSGMNFTGLTTFSTGINLTQPVYTFTSNGNYFTYLTVMDPVTSCSAAAGQTIVITGATSPICNLNAYFSATQGTGGSMTLNNQSGGTIAGTTYTWDFGDNSGTSNLTSPVHTYSADGVYMATLTANNNTTNTCISSIVKVVKVCGYIPVVPSFVYSSNTAGNVTFTSTSTGTNIGTYYTWYTFTSPNYTFASGTNATQASTTFNNNGTVSVFLNITNPVTTCANTTSQTVVVNNVCVANAAFSLTPTNTPQVWSVIPASPANVTSATWSWGDGATSNTLYSSHSYSAAGYYYICLSVTVSCGATNSYCNSQYLYKGSGVNDAMIQVDVLDSATVGLKNISNNESEDLVFPNPNSGSFNLKINGLTDRLNIVLYDATGKIIYCEVLPTKGGNVIKEINLNGVSNGIYFLKANSGNEIFNKKIVIEK